MTLIKPIILGCSGTVLTPEERDFFQVTQPFGFILFQRNCDSPEQVREITRDLRTSVGRDDLPIFVDQEGGRVARLKPPYWHAYPELRQIGELYERDPALGRKAMHLHSQLIASMLRDVGINGNCAPVLDLMIEGASSAIGDRALSSDPDVVISCGQIAVDTYLRAGVFPVIKHLPGHGRVKVDPHIDLPFVDTPLEVLEQLDFKPFISLRHAPIAMNCHVVFRGIDPHNPVSLSRKAHQEILREKIGFDGLIFSDDLAMGALSLPLEERAYMALEAGADVALYCTGNLENAQIACAGLPALNQKSAERWERAKALCVTKAVTVEAEKLQARFDRLMDIAVTLAA